MKERPILFNGAMVRAERAGLKTMTRRLLRQQPDIIVGDLLGQPHWYLDADPSLKIRCPYGVPGDRLWVRETWAPCDGGPIFAADYDGDKARAGVERWHPGIHLRRDDARTLLEVTAVRVERLQAITEEDAKAEGLRSDAEALRNLSHIRGAEAPRHVPSHLRGARNYFRDLWDEINGERATWASNPWVWVVSFQRVSP